MNNELTDKERLDWLEIAAADRLDEVSDNVLSCNMNVRQAIDWAMKLEDVDD